MHRRGPFPSGCSLALPAAAVRRLLPGPVRWLPLWLCSALLPPLFGALLPSCGDEGDPLLPPRPDGGVECEPGTQGCACAESNACFNGLLCTSGRCLPVEGSGGREPDVRVPVQQPCAAAPCDPGPASSN